MSKESFPKSNTEPEKSGEMGKKLRKLGLSLSLLFGAGLAADKIAGRNSAEKVGADKAVASSVVKSGPDTYKSEGNMSPESVPGFVPDKIVEKKLENQKMSDPEKWKVHKSGPDTYKSE